MLRFTTVLAVFCLAFLVFAQTDHVQAEDIQNYSGCDVCPGGIHFHPKETREILPEKTRDTIRSMRPKRPGIKIDLDGVLPQGSQNTPSAGYEIYSYGYNPFYIKSLIDGSRIQVITDPDGLQHVNKDKWKPEMYLYSSKANDISLTDSVDAAWSTFKKSHISYWISSESNERQWLHDLGQKIAEMLRMVYR